MTFVHELLSFS